MSILRRSLLELSSSSKRLRLLLNPVSNLHQTSYSTSTRKYTPRKPKSEASPTPEEGKSSWSSSSTITHIRKAVEELDWPRPSEIPWQGKVANSVNLIGRVKVPVQIHAAPEGKCWSGTVISQESASQSSSLWIPIIFEGDLAHIAACHLKENDYVYVAGCLNADPPPFTFDEGNATIQVLVHSINFVEESSRFKENSASHEQKIQAVDHSASIRSGLPVIQLWRDLLLRPHEWWDIRLDKGNATGAAFERKDNGQIISIDASTPEWFLPRLKSLTFDRKIVQEGQGTTYVKKEENCVTNPWKDLTNNSNEWWDYRKDKRNGLVKPNFPDFKRKDGSISLWLDRAPNWALSKLETLKFDSRLQERKPEKLHKGSKEELWNDLVGNPNKWWDNRLQKTKEKAPDFKHKDSGEGLWLNDSPAWVLPKLQPPKARPVFTISKKDTLLT